MEIEINGTNPAWQEKCRQLAEDHKPFAIVNFNLEKMLAFCNSIAKEYEYEVKVLREQPGVCHFIPRGASDDAIPLVFSGSPED
jgi:hypothetical protein